MADYAEYGNAEYGTTLLLRSQSIDLEQKAQSALKNYNKYSTSTINIEYCNYLMCV